MVEDKLPVSRRQTGNARAPRLLTETILRSGVVFEGDIVAFNIGAEVGYR